jgi:hypothetical protein
MFAVHFCLCVNPERRSECASASCWLFSECLAHGATRVNTGLRRACKQARMFPAQVRNRPCYYDRWRVSHCAKPGEHIVFMGDSLTRYQWLALAASFHRKVELSGTEFPSLVKEREWRHWMPFYNGSTELLMPNSRCDCHRSFARPVGSKTVENRYFWTTEGGGLNLSFIQVLNPETILGHWMPSGNLSDERHRANVHKTFAPLWRMEWQECLREIVAKLQPKPTVLVLNMGLWSGPPNASYAANLERTARSAAPRVVWKTTTRMRKSGPSKWLRTDLLPRRVFGEIFDAARLTSALSDRDYWDPRHFKAHVYNHLNAALLRQLYGPPTQCVEFNHGRCTQGKTPTLSSAPAEPEREQAVAEAGPNEGWTGVAHRHPTEWSPLQTLMWVDSLNTDYDAKAFASRRINGSDLLAIERQSRFSELGISAAARRRVLEPRLARAMEQRRSQTHIVSVGRRATLHPVINTF